MMDSYYIKKGRRYYPVERFSGFPADGVWIVRDAGKNNQLIMRIGPVMRKAETIRYIASTKHHLKEAILEILMQDKYKTMNDVADAIAEKILEDEINDKTYY